MHAKKMIVYIFGVYIVFEIRLVVHYSSAFSLTMKYFIDIIYEDQINIEKCTNNIICTPVYE